MSTDAPSVDVQMTGDIDTNDTATKMDAAMNADDESTAITPEVTGNADDDDMDSAPKGKKARVDTPKDKLVKRAMASLSIKSFFKTAPGTCGSSTADSSGLGTVADSDPVTTYSEGSIDNPAQTAVDPNADRPVDTVGSDTESNDSRACNDHIRDIIDQNQKLIIMSKERVADFLENDDPALWLLNEQEPVGVERYQKVYIGYRSDVKGLHRGSYVYEIAGALTYRDATYLRHDQIKSFEPFHKDPDASEKFRTNH
eukprot:11850218-Karenia_brevis.AAC.1